MMRNLLFTFLVLTTFIVKAQTPYSTLDSLVSRIKSQQATAENLGYTSNGETYKLSFAPESFGVLVYNRLAYHGVYKISGSKEIQEITENIDLTKAKSLSYSENNGTGVVTMSFPEGVLQTMVFENGNQQSSNQGSSLQFFCKGDPKPLYSLLAELQTYLNQENTINSDPNLKAPQNLAQEWANLQSRPYPEGLALAAKFLKDNPNSLYTEEAKKLFDTFMARKNFEERRAAEASAALDRIYALALKGDQSYRNYDSYKQAEDHASQLLAKYTAKEIGTGFTKLQSFQKELHERIKWNREYYVQRDQILAYDAVVKEAAYLGDEFTRKNNATVNGSLYLKASLLALGGISTLIGAYATIAKDDSFDPETSKAFLMYGGAAFGVGMLWTVIQGKGVKKSMRRYTAAQKRVRDMKEAIGEVLNKRTETLNGRPLININ